MTATFSRGMLFGLIAVTGAGWASAQTPPITDLGTLGPLGALGLNNAGQAVLGSDLYSGGIRTPLGMTGYAINVNGHVTGAIGQNIGLYINGAVTDLGNVGDPIFNTAEGRSINDNDEIAGRGDWRSANYGFYYKGGIKTRIGLIPNASVVPIDTTGFGINNSGLMVGITRKDAGGQLGSVGYIYDTNALTWTDLGPGAAYAINASGQITGVSSPSLQGSNVVAGSPLIPGQAYLYDQGTFTLFGTLGGPGAAGFALNATGQITGASDIVGSTARHAFFVNGAMTDLNAFIDSTDPLQPYVTLTEGRAINDTRLILAKGIDSRDQSQHAYLVQAPWSDVSPGRLSFASQAVGTTSASQTLTLKNSGTSTMAVGTTTIAGDFVQTTTCGASLAPGATCTAAVSFQPTVGGDSSGVLTFVTDGYPNTVRLAGVSPLIVTMSANPATALVGQPVTITWSSAPSASCHVKNGSDDNGFFGSKTASGTDTVTHTAPGTATYMLTCTQGAQTADGSVSVVVN